MLARSQVVIEARRLIEAHDSGADEDRVRECMDDLRRAIRMLNAWRLEADRERREGPRVAS